jgi:hypothetical protein
MQNLIFKVSGAATGLVTEIELSAQLLANHLQHGFNGRYANELQASQLTQEFVNNHKVIAKYHSVTFLGFKVTKEDDADNEFETFKKK